MARSLLSPMPSSPQFSSIYRRLALLPCRFVGISTSVRAHRRLLFLRAAAQSPGPAGDDASSPSQEDAQKKNSKTAAPDLPSLPYPNIPIWARWVLGAAVILAVPFYRRFLKIEGEVKKTAKAAVGVVEKVAEATEKIAMDVAEALPENTKLKQVALEVEEIAEVVDKEAKLAETILEEVDDVVEKVDTLVEPIVDELEGGEGEVTRQGKDSKETIGEGEVTRQGKDSKETI